MQIGAKAGLEPTNTQLRDVFGAALLEVAQKDSMVVALDGDLGNSNGAALMRQNIPGRFFNLGIAEANLVGVGAGMAAAGLVPFIISFPSFLLCNAYDQIRLQIAMASLNAKLVGSHSGLTPGREGPPPMSIEDYALAGGLPTMVILVPSDPATMKKAVQAAAKYIGPVYIRSSREALPHIYKDDDCPFQIGKAINVREGKDVTLIACGLMVSVTLDAAAILAEQGIQARVLDMHTLRPMDQNAVIAAARETGALVTAEEHLIRGGMGAQVAQIVAANYPVPMRFIGIDEKYSDSGSLPELLKEHKLTAEDIVYAAKSAMAARETKA
jgi:transketolase